MMTLRVSRRLVLIGVTCFVAGLFAVLLSNAIWVNLVQDRDAAVESADSRANSERIAKIEQARDKEKAAAAAKEQAESTIEDCRRDDAVAEKLRERGRCKEASEARVTVAEIGADNGTATPTPRDGRDGTDGPTLAQVVATLQPRLLALVQPAIDDRIDSRVNTLFAACVASGQCVGPAGQSIQGPKGDTGSKGDTGATGAQGESVQGDDAPRIVDIVCDGTTGRFAFDDGSTIDVPGMCADDGLIPEPAPEPDPTPTP